MEPGTHLLAQALSLSGLIAASAAYAGMIRRRQHGRTELRTATAASDAAVARVERSLALGRIDRTFVRSAYIPKRRR